MWSTSLVQGSSKGDVWQQTWVIFRKSSKIWASSGWRIDPKRRSFTFWAFQIDWGREPIPGLVAPVGGASGDAPPPLAGSHVWPTRAAASHFRTEPENKNAVTEVIIHHSRMHDCRAGRDIAKYTVLALIILIFLQWDFFFFLKKQVKVKNIVKTYR